MTHRKPRNGDLDDGKLMQIGRVALEPFHKSLHILNHTVDNENPA